MKTLEELRDVVENLLEKSDDELLDMVEDIKKSKKEGAVGQPVESADLKFAK